MTDFAYNDTLNFAVNKGLISLSDKGMVESSAFKRDEMVFLSYKSLSTMLKGGNDVLSKKLGLTDVPKVVLPSTVTIKRVFSEDGKSCKYIIDKKTLPDAFKNFTYLSTSGIDWFFPTTNQMIHYLIPNLTYTSNSEEMYDQDAAIFHYVYAHTIVNLFDQEKKLIGYFDIMDKTSKNIQVTIMPVKAFDLGYPEIKTGLTTNVKGELIIDRNLLPSAVKNYSKVAIDIYTPSDESGVYFTGELLRTNRNTKYYTTSVIDILNTGSYLTDKLCIHFFNNEGQVIGYAKTDAKNILQAMKAKLDAANIKEITKGVVVSKSDGFTNTVYVIMSEVDYASPSDFAFMSFGALDNDANQISFAYLESNKKPGNNTPFSPSGFASMIPKDQNFAGFMKLYNKDNKFIAYSKIDPKFFGSRTDVFKSIEVSIEKDIEGGFSNSYFSIDYYKDGKLIASQQPGPFERSMIPGNVVITFKEIFIDPNENYEVKVSTNRADIKIKGITIK